MLYNNKGLGILISTVLIRKQSIPYIQQIVDLIGDSEILFNVFANYCNQSTLENPSQNWSYVFREVLLTLTSEYKVRSITTPLNSTTNNFRYACRSEALGN
jgi:hypothetical protein